MTSRRSASGNIRQWCALHYLSATAWGTFTALAFFLNLSTRPACVSPRPGVLWS
jgi:phosphatidate phosphatase APP1